MVWCTHMYILCKEKKIELLKEPMDSEIIEVPCFLQGI